MEFTVTDVHTISYTFNISQETIDTLKQEFNEIYEEKTQTDENWNNFISEFLDSMTCDPGMFVNNNDDEHYSISSEIDEDWDSTYSRDEFKKVQEFLNQHYEN